MNSDERERLAKQRFFLLSAMRFVSVILVMAGIANIAGRLFPDATPYLGYGFLLIGLIEFFLMPVVLKKAWTKQDAAGK
jgi:F0F1-type ATP synthase assembly protein I